MSASPPADSPRPAPRRQRRRVVGVVIVAVILSAILAILAAGFLTPQGRQGMARVMAIKEAMFLPAASPKEAQPQTPPQDALARRLAALEAALDRTAALAAQVRERPVSSSGAARLNDRLDKLTRTVAQLEERIAGLESRMTPDRAALVAVAAANLATASGSGPFSAELTVLNRLLQGDEDVQTLLHGLTAASDGGVADRERLQAGFSDMAADVVVAARRESGKGIWGHLAAQVLSVAVLRRVNDDQGDGVEAVLVRMQQRLTASDLDGVLEEARGFTPAAHQAAGDWLAQVMARRDLDRAVRELMLQAVNSMAQPEAAAQPEG